MACPNVITAPGLMGCLLGWVQDTGVYAPCTSVGCQVNDLWLIWIQFLKAIADPRLIYYCIDRSPSSIAQWLVAIFQDEVLDPVFGFAIARTTRYIGIRDSAKSFVAKIGIFAFQDQTGRGWCCIPI